MVYHHFFMKRPVKLGCRSPICSVTFQADLPEIWTGRGPQALDTNWLVNMRDLENKVEAHRQERYKQFVPWRSGACC